MEQCRTNLEQFRTTLRIWNFQKWGANFSHISQIDAGRTAARYFNKQVARVLRYTSRSDPPHTHYRKTEKNRVLHGDTSTLRTASSTQLTAQQYRIQYNTVRTHFTMMFFSNDWRYCDFHLFTSNSKIRCRPKITCYINILYMG